MVRVASVVCSANSLSFAVCSMGIVGDRSKPAVGVGGKLDTLDRGRAVAGAGEQLLAGER